MIYAAAVLFAISIVAMFVAFSLVRVGTAVETPQQPLTPEEQEWAFHSGKVAGRRHA